MAGWGRVAGWLDAGWMLAGTLDQLAPRWRLRKRDEGWWGNRGGGGGATGAGGAGGGADVRPAWDLVLGVAAGQTYISARAIPQS